MNQSEHLKRYRIERKLFEGVFTTVHLVTDLLNGELRVLKASDVDRYPCSYKQQLFNELVFHGIVDSPHIVRKYHSFQIGSILYVVLEYAPGGDLFSYVWIENKPMTDHFIRKILYQTCLALRAIHQKGLVHRDIKPENILLDKNGDVKLCDFGWCCEENDIMSNSESAGTLAYMSPEAHHCLPQTSASDIWALGILIYEMYHKKEPYPGETPVARLHSIRTTKPVFDRSFPADAADIFYHCTAINPKWRKPLSWILEHPYFRELAQRSKKAAVSASSLERSQAPEHQKNDQLLEQIFLPTKNLNDNPYLMGAQSSVNSMELSAKNQGSNYAPLLRNKKNHVRATVENSFERESSIRAERISKEFSVARHSIKTISIERKSIGPGSSYRPLSVPRRKPQENGTSVENSSVISQKKEPKIKDHKMWDIAEVTDHQLFKKRNSSQETSSASKVDFKAKKVIISDNKKPAILLQQSSNERESRITYPLFSDNSLNDINRQRTANDLVNSFSRIAKHNNTLADLHKSANFSASKKMEASDLVRRDNFTMSQRLHDSPLYDPTFFVPKPIPEVISRSPQVQPNKAQRNIPVNGFVRQVQNSIVCKKPNDVPLQKRDHGNGLKLKIKPRDACNSQVLDSPRDNSLHLMPSPQAFPTRSNFPVSNQVLNSLVSKYSLAKEKPPANNTYFPQDFTPTAHNSQARQPFSANRRSMETTATIHAFTRQPEIIRGTVGSRITWT